MALSGDGGDEVLSGYNGYQSERLAGCLAWAPTAPVEALAGLLRLVGRPLGTHRKEAVNHAAKIIRLSAVPFQKRLLQKAWADLAIVRALLADVDTPQLPVDEFLADFLRRCPWRDSFYQLMFYNLKLTLPEDMLTKVDRMGMANSLEVRAPFLDHRLVELMSGVAKQVKLPFFMRKAVLRRTVARQLPECVTRARKRGFVAPVRRWFASEQAFDVVEEFLNGCPLPFRRDVIAEILETNARRDADYGNFLWMVLVLAKWMKGRDVCVAQPA
jgi:asparagine synthase (glutamine-hydrolysing)